LIPKGSKLLDGLTPEEKEIYLKEREAKKTEQKNAQKVLHLFTNHIKSLGFNRTKPTFWVREKTNLVQFINIHKRKHRPDFDIFTCIRPYNSSLEFIALEGELDRQLLSGVNFVYSDTTDSVEQCAVKMASFVQRHSETWYEKFSDQKVLLGTSSPFDEQHKKDFKQALEGNAIQSQVDRTKELLKIV